MEPLSAHELRLLLQNRRDLPLAVLDGPPPTRIMPVQYELGQGARGQRSNYWHQESRAFDSTSNEPNQISAPTMNNKVASANVSSSIGEASRAGGHNINTLRGDGLHITSSSSASSNRPMSALISPTRLRSNGILGAETSTAMTSLGQSSLLSGSAPDFESSNVSSSSAYKNRQGSTIGRGRRQFKVEDTEEFVPSHLKEQGTKFAGSKEFNNNELSPFNGPGSIIGPPFQSKTQARNTDNTAWSSSVQNTSVDPSLHYSTSHTVSGGIPPTGTYSQSIWNASYTGSGFNHVESTANPRRTSNLRPDVEAYRPFDYDDSVNPHLSQQGNHSYAYNRRNDLRTSTNNGPAHTTNQRAIATNGNAFSANSLTAPNDTYSHRNTSRSNQMSFPNVSQHNANNLRLRELNISTPCRGSDHMMPAEPTPLAANESASVPSYQAPAPAQYNSSQYGLIPELSPRMAQFHQQYNVDQAASVPPYYSDESYASRPLSNGVPRSELLEEFRAYNKSRKYELKDIYGYIVEFSGDQAGSRFIQNKLEQANSDEKDQIFSELQTNARQLMSDVFGNYVIQKMFEYGNQSQKKILASYMQGNVLKLSLQPFGCRCVQKAFEHILTDQQAVLIKELENYVLSVVESQHGNHVIQKAIECIPGEYIQFIVDAHKGQIVRLSKHTYGCRIIQRMLEYCTPQARRAILDELRYAIPSLIDDQFGNYVVQCMIRTCNPADRYHVVGFVQKELLFYSKHKFASNVVEKAIQYADDEQRDAMVRRLTGPDPHNGMQRPVSDLLKDQYGNYVIQTVLRTIQGPARRALADEVRYHLNMMGKISRGKQFAAMEETLAVVSAAHSPSSISTGPQTPRTPTSTNSGDNDDTTIAKPIDGVLPPFSRRESQRGVLSLSQFHT